MHQFYFFPALYRACVNPLNNTQDKHDDQVEIDLMLYAVISNVLTKRN